MTIHDLRYAIRNLRRAPGFTAIAVLTIALGIGATTAIFTVVDVLLLRPLPYPASERLVMVWQDWTSRGGPSDEWASPGNFLDWQSEPGLVESAAAISGWRPALTGHGEAEALPGEQVSHQYFSVLGIPPLRGRSFQPADDVPNAPRVAMISEEAWTRRFGGDPALVGSTLNLGGAPHEIIGIVPAGFRPVIMDDAEVWRPLRLELATPSRGAVILRVVARLPKGVTLEEAQTRASALARRLESVYPGSNQGVGFNVQSLHDRVVGEVRPALLALIGGVGCLLLIAATNVANLLTARGSRRGRELAVNLALGASRWRIANLLLSESLVIAVLGGVGGVIVAQAAVRGLVAMAPVGTPRLGEISLDLRVLAFSAGLTLVTGVLFGMIPALQQSRSTTSRALKEGRGLSTAGQRLRRALIAVEVALAVVLLTGGVLLIQTFLRLGSTDLGFDTRDVLVGFFNPPASAYETSAEYLALYDEVLRRAEAIPGVRRAALASVIPLSAGDSDSSFDIEGRPVATTGAESTVTWYREVSAGYFDAIGMKIIRGNAFREGEPMPSVVVNETFVRRFFAAEDPLGKRIRFGGEDDPWFTIVGVVGDARFAGAREPTRAEAFLPYWQLPARGMTVVLAGPNAASFAPALRGRMAAIDSNLPLVGVQTMEQTLRESLGQARFVATIAGTFASLAVLLAAVGIYGVMAYAVAQRTTEIGLRMALGSTVSGVFRLVVGDGLRLALVGGAIGIASSLVAAQWMRSLLFGIAPTDPFTLGLTALVLLAVAVAASVLPAWRASRVDPMVALRAE
jgi:putative ABC transport system permease protein